MSNENLEEASTTEKVSTMPLKRLKIFTILICLIGDWIVAGYLYVSIIKNKEYFEKILNMALQIQGISNSALDPTMMNQIIEKGITTTIAMLLLFLGLHMICYWLYYLDKGFGKFYVKSLAYLGVPFFGIFALTTLSTPLFSLLLFIQVMLYFFIIKGHKNIKN